MADIPSLGERQAKKALRLLGFDIDETRGKGSHSLAEHPKRKPSPLRQRPFIVIPHRKEFGNRSFRKDFIKEIIAFGFSKEEVIKALRGKR